MDSHPCSPTWTQVKGHTVCTFTLFSLTTGISISDCDVQSLMLQQGSLTSQALKGPVVPKNDPLAYPNL